MINYFSKLLLNIALLGSCLDVNEAFMHVPKPMLSTQKLGQNTNICLSMDRRNMLLKSLVIFNIPFLNKLAADAYTIDEDAHINLYEKLAPSVCYISTEYKNVAGKLDLNTSNIPKGVGTGFIWDKQGHIVTNFHVINKVDKAQITLTDKNGATKDYVAKLTGVDPDKDIAVIKVDLDDKTMMELLPIPIATNKDIKIGQYAFAIGNPFGQDHTFTMGIISGKNRELTSPTGRKIKNVIQTDTPINPGNSGGPLLDSSAKLIGMNTATMGMGVSSGVNFAISVDTVKETVNQIIKYGTVQRAVLGISYLERSPSLEESKKSGIPFIAKGVIVLDVPESSPSYKSGLRGIQKTSTPDERSLNKLSKLDAVNMTQRVLGDIIVGINEYKIDNANDLLNTLDNFKPNDKIKLHILRGNNLQPLILDVTLGSFKVNTFSGMLPEKESNDSQNSEEGGVELPLQNIAPQLEPRMSF